MSQAAETTSVDLGACEVTGCRTALHTGPERDTDRGSAEKARLLYVTDPLCSGCWAFEPAWRRLLYRYGAEFSITYVYGGLLPSWEGFADPGAGISAPRDVATHWDAVSQASGQPIDSRVWLSDPPASSYPASIAAAAVRLVAPEQEGRYLRRLRELVFLEHQNIARPEVLRRALEAIDIDSDVWRAMLESGAAERAFAADRLLARSLRVQVFPTVLLDAAGPPRLLAEGSLAPTALERALLRAAATPLVPRRAPRSAAVLESYRTGTSAELAAALSLPVPDAERELTSTGARPRPAANGTVWER
jgi:protein-disulfide isomerase-like protein with CxxC motif